MEFVGIDKFSLLDYDEKVSVVLFSPACNFRCPFCHNGDSVLNSNTPIPFEDIYAFLKSRQGLIDAVVFTGGEPTLMPELKERIKAVKELGFLIKLDTNGTNPEILEDLLKEGLLDYVAMDIKNSFVKYAMTVGVKNAFLDKISQTIKFLMTSGIDYEFRTTLIDEFHNEQDIRDIAETIKGAKRLYLQKYVDRESCIAHGFHEVSKEKAERFVDILKGSIEQVALRGY